MDLTVREILKLPEFCDVELVAGHEGLDRPVTGVNIIEVPTVTHWMRGGEILFSSGFAFGGESCEGCRLLNELNDYHIAALVLKPGSYLKKIAPQMIETANQLKFPLISMPEDRPYSHYMDPIFSLLLNQRAKALEVSHNICNHLFIIAVDDSYFNLCTYVSERLNQPVYLTDGSGKILIGNEYPEHKDYNEALAFVTRQKDSKQGFVNQVTYRHDDKRLRLIYIPITVSHNLVNYLTAIETHESDRELCRAVLPFVARIIQIQELHHHSLLQQKNKISGDLLGDILENRYDDAALILQRGKLLNIDLTKSLVVVVIRFMVHEHTAKEDQEAALAKEEEIRRILREQVIQIAPRVLFLDHDHSLGCLIQVDGINGHDDVNEIVENVVRKADSSAGCTLSVGISRRTKGIADVPRLFEQATIASQVAVTEKNTSVCLKYFDDLGIWKMYPDFRESEEMAQLAQEVIGPLVAYDRENGTEFLLVLKTFYDNNGVLSQTAKKLFIHKNTMIKYLRTIEEIMGRDLREYKSVAEIMLCLMVFKDK